MAVKFLNGIDVEGSMNLHSSDIPNLDASKITSGTLSADRIPNLSGVYQPAGDYLTLETAETSFQPLGNYLTSVPSEYLTQTEGDARYLQSLPSHSHDTLTSTWQNINLDTLTKGDYNLGFEHFSTTSSGTKPPINDNANALLHIGTHSGGYWHQLAFSSTEDMYYRATQSNSIGSWRKVWDSGNLTNVSQLTNDSGYLTSLPSHNHDTLYDAIGSADAVATALNERIDTEVFDAITTVDGNIPTNNNQLTNGAGYITDLPNAGIGAGTYGSTSNQIKIDTITVDAKGRITAVSTGTGGDITTVRLVDDAGSYVQDTGGTAVLTIAGGSGITTSASGTTITVTNDEAGQADAVNTRIDEEVFPAIGDVSANIPTNNNQLTNGAGYITSSSLPSGSQLVRVYNNVNYVPSGDIDQRGNYGMGVTVYEGYSGGTNRPHTYDTTAQFMSTTSQGFELSVDWVSPNTTPLKIRSLRDCCQGWSNWKDVAVAEDVVNGNFYFADSIQVGSKITHYGDSDTYLIFDANRIRLIAGGSTKFDSNNTYATTSYVDTAVSNLVDSAPGALNTLNELAAALGDDANFSTTVTNNIAAVDARINDEVFPALGDIQTAVDGKLDATAKAADSNLLDGINSTSFLRSDQADTMSGTLTITGSNGVSRLRIEGTTPTIDLDDADGDSFYIHVNSNNFYVLADRDGAGNYGTWEGPHPMQLEADTNSAYFFGNKLNSAAYQASSAFDSAGSASTAQANAIAHADDRIDSEIQPAIDTIGGLASTAHGWGDHASAGYLTSVPSSLSVTSLAVGSGVTLTESTDRSDLLMIKSSTSTWGGLQISNTSNEIIFSLMGDGTTGGIYDDQNSDWLIQWTENGGLTLGYNNVTKLTTTSVGVTISGTVTATGGNSGNWNTAYGWGNHASAGYLTSIPSDYVRQAQDIVSGNIHPLGDREQLLGLDSNRWQIVFCEILDSAGQHEKNLQNPAGETSVADYATGTVMVWENGKNVPCTTYANHMRMGIAVENVDSPMIQGAEPVLVTGSVSEGDYLVTSTTTGHAVAVSRDTVKQEQLWDCVIGKALEGGEGESHLIKTWVTI